jgi:hypothetical protein
VCPAPSASPADGPAARGAARRRYLAAHGVRRSRGPGLTTTSFVDALLAAPVGVALLARLERRQRRDLSFWENTPAASLPTAVRAAVDALEGTTLDELVAIALDAGQIAGPWTADAESQVARAYRRAHDRRPLAEAVAERFAADLHGEVEAVPQEWWLSYQPAEPWYYRRLFEHLDDGYGNGEFTWNGLWTVGAPPAEAHDSLAGAWELLTTPVTRWEVPLRPGARIWSIHRPEDWVELVTTYPRPARSRHEGWELPGPNQHLRRVQDLFAVPTQNAARYYVRRHLVPDWPAVARDWDAVHLSWAGYLTTEGFVSDLDGGGATMLRYWFSERTLWLNDVLGDPQPLPAPGLSGSISGLQGADARTDPTRRAEDERLIQAQLGR